MRVVILGGGGAMCASAVYDLYKTSKFDEFIIADIDEVATKHLINVILERDERFKFVKADLSDKNVVSKLLKESDCFIQCSPFTVERPFLEALMENSNLVGVDLNAFEFDYVLSLSPKLAERNITLWFANGGLVITSSLALMGLMEVDEAEEVNIYWGMWRPITFTTKGLTATVFYELDPTVKERIVWEDGRIRFLPPFALMKEFTFPEPIGRVVTYVLAHTEPLTLPHSELVKEKKVRRIIARGAWHPSWINLIKALIEAKVFEAEPITINGRKIRPIDVIIDSIPVEREFRDPHDIVRITGFRPTVILSAEVIGYRKGVGRRIVYHHIPPYPFFDGKHVRAMWEYGSYVGTALSITLQLMLQHEIHREKKGVIFMETSGLSPQLVLEEFRKRGFKTVKEEY
jgi:saccharopine dehydrogenase-like NADP-dependent oxidoreductase